jgi:transposase
MRTKELLSRETITDLFTAVFVMVDDYLQEAVKHKRFKLPCKSNQKGSYSEIMTIVIMGEILQQNNQGAWYMIVKQSYAELFPVLPDITRFYRIQRNLTRIYADFAMLLAEHDGNYAIDSTPVAICHPLRRQRARSITQATTGYGGVSKRVHGFKLHAIVSGRGAICRFALIPANEHDVTVARYLLDKRVDDLRALVGDKGYQGLGIFTPPKRNAKQAQAWCSFFATLRKRVESVFSSLKRCRHLALQQLNSFWSINASVCRKVAAHNLLIFLA